jgi:hypothetical protein
MNEAFVLTVRRCTARCGCTWAGPAERCAEGVRLFAAVEQAYSRAAGAPPADDQAWSPYETRRAAYYRHLGERIAPEGAEGSGGGAACQICGNGTAQWLWLPFGASGKRAPLCFALPEQALPMCYACKALLESGGSREVVIDGQPYTVSRAQGLLPSRQDHGAS